MFSKAKRVATCSEAGRGGARRAGRSEASEAERSGAMEQGEAGQGEAKRGEEAGRGSPFACVHDNLMGCFETCTNMSPLSGTDRGKIGTRLFFKGNKTEGKLGVRSDAREVCGMSVLVQGHSPIPPVES